MYGEPFFADSVPALVVKWLHLHFLCVLKLVNLIHVIRYPPSKVILDHLLSLWQIKLARTTESQQVVVVETPHCVELLISEPLSYGIQNLLLIFA